MASVLFYVFLINAFCGPYVYGAAAIISLSFMIYFRMRKKNAKPAMVSLIIFASLTFLVTAIWLSISVGIIRFM